DHHRRMMSAYMRELQPARHIADGIDAAVAGAQPAVDRDAVRPVGDAGSIEAEPLHARPSSGRDEQMATVDRALPVSGLDGEPKAVADRFYARRFGLLV